ncbi:MAG: hypothetical protein EZS28_025253 [Streblomastix strix]|uniref:PABC domain-containing protein n=1 Tax=Streblomastix strix TaxID=222440 RepID=A0A5J4V9V7_9EUKA|nr:MAG: hypothetical protein EZS28_025253 [Streblomastix strix]
MPQIPFKSPFIPKSIITAHSQSKSALYPKDQNEFQGSSNLARSKSLRYSNFQHEILYDPIIQQLPIIRFDPQILQQIPPDQHKQYIGEFIFTKISAVDKSNALMIIEIFLELDNVMLVILLRNDQLLIQKDKGLKTNKQYIWAAPQGFNSATLFVTIIPAPNDYYNQGSIHQCDTQMIQTIQSKHQ